MARGNLDAFYVKIASADDTVDHCPSLTDCDVLLPVKRHLLRRRHTMELRSLAWGPAVEADGVRYPRTVAMSFENDQYVGVLMELYTLNETALGLAPVWEDDLDAAAFVRQRTWVLVAACVLFAVGIFGQRWQIRRQIERRQREEDRRNGLYRTRGQADIEVEEEEPPSKWGYKDYALASAVANSLLLEGVVFGFLAVGGPSMHLTSFHVTNLQVFPADKRRASPFVSAGFGAGLLVLPVLQVIHQYGDVSLQAIAACYSVVALLLTANGFFVQPWRAWNTLGSEAELDPNPLRWRRF